MNDFLKKILDHKRHVIAEKKDYYARVKEQLDQSVYTRYRLFEKQISRAGQINLIAEIKKASPSQGLIRDDFDVLAIAKIYTENHAAAISILTEDKYFLGKPEYIKKVTDHFEVAVLTKDFILDEGQIYEARLNGASAVLLIMAMLDDKQAQELMGVADRLDLDCLVEIHDETELKRALGIGARIIGINNRNLTTFEVDLQTSLNLIPQIPQGKVIVAESGIKTRADVLALQKAGAHAILVGETFMREQDIAKKIKELMGS